MDYLKNEVVLMKLIKGGGFMKRYKVIYLMVAILLVAAVYPIINF